MHETLSPNFKGYIDNFYIDSGNNLRLSGWIVTTHDKRDVDLFLHTTRKIGFYNHNERQDVADFYQTSNINYLTSGFDITIPNDAAVDVFKISAEVKGKVEEIFHLPKAQGRVETIQPQLGNESVNMRLKSSYVPDLLVVDNFYENPDEIRQMALNQNFAPDLRYHKGNRTETQFLPQGLKQTFESLLGRRITRWTDYNYNGVFQYCTAEDPLVYHSDLQSYAAAIYLTPNAPIETGTSFYRSKHTGARSSKVSDANYNDTFKGGFYDKTQFELVDTVGNVYNRLSIWNSSLIHSASGYFGTDKYNSRLFHLFFFDIEE